MVYMCVMLSGMLCLWLAGYIRNSKIRFVRSMSLTFVFYFMIYVLVSAVLFVFDIFLIRYAVVGTGAICGICFLINLGLFSRGKFNRDKEWVSEKDSYVSFALIAFSAILTWGNFGFVGMGSDQGVYPTQAINFFYDKTEMYQDIEEYEALEDTEYKAFYEEQIKKDELRGYDLLIEYEHVPTINVSSETGEAEGIFHGIPTYSAILGLSAKILGLENMPLIGLLFYVCLLCMMEFVLTDLNISCWVRGSVVLLLGMSPQVVWGKSSTLTEGFIAVLIVTYIYYILHPDRGKSFWSVMPITTFAFFHVTIFTMMPMFILIYVYRYISERKKMYLWCIRIISVTYLLGFFMMVKVQPIYTLDRNYSQVMRFLSLEQIIATACLGSCFGIVISYFVQYINLERSTIEKVCKSALRVIAVAAIAHLVFMAGVRYKTWEQIRSMTLVCYSVLTGVFLIPCILYRLIEKKYGYNIELGTVGILFSWCIVFYSMVMIKQIRFYYYFSRYLMPYLVVVLILFAILMTAKKLGCVFAVIGVLILMPYAMVVSKAKDDTNIQWNTFISVLKEAETADTVILDNDLMRIFFFPIRAAGNARVYPVYETLEKTLDYIETGDNVLYISRRKEENINPWLSVRYRDYAEIKMESRSSGRNFVLGLPQMEAVNTEIYPVTVYQYNDSYVYEDNYLSGWSPANTAGYRWMWREDAYLECFLRKEDYQMIIHPGYAIPFDSIQADKISVNIYLNETFLGTIDWTEEDTLHDKSLDIPLDYIMDGCNIIHFVSDLWSPAEYGAEDKSTYGFSAGSIELRKSVK